MNSAAKIIIMVEIRKFFAENLKYYFGFSVEIRSNTPDFHLFFTDKQDDFIAEFVGQVDAAQGEAAAPRGDFVGLHCVENVGELLDFVVGITVGSAIFEAVEFLVIEIFDGFHGRLHRAYLLTFWRFGRASGAIALANDNRLLGAVSTAVVAENIGNRAQRQQRNQ